MIYKRYPQIIQICHIYIYIYVYMIYVYVYIYIERERCIIVCFELKAGKAQKAGKARHGELGGATCLTLLV